jgi:hypothetical protein
VTPNEQWVFIRNLHQLPQLNSSVKAMHPFIFLNGLGYILGHFFPSSSGHPVRDYFFGECRLTSEAFRGNATKRQENGHSTVCDYQCMCEREQVTYKAARA